MSKYKRKRYPYKYTKTKKCPSCKGRAKELFTPLVVVDDKEEFELKKVFFCPTCPDLGSYVLYADT